MEALLMGTFAGEGILVLPPFLHKLVEAARKSFVVHDSISSHLQIRSSSLSYQGTGQPIAS